MTPGHPPAPGLLAIRDEMSRQHADARASLRGAGAMAARVAASVRASGRLLLLGMGASHAAGRAVEPLYRAAGFEALALPLSEQLNNPLPLTGWSVILSSQSGESAEVLRWLDTAPLTAGIFGLTMSADSTLARRAPSLLGAGGPETAFAATRSLMVTTALHAAVLAELGLTTEDVEAVLDTPAPVDVSAAVTAMDKVTAIVTSGRRLHGVAEAIALGLTELSRIPCFALEGGQLRHGPMEMLGPDVGVVLFRGQDETAELVGRLAAATAAAGSPTVVFDACDSGPVAGVTTVRLAPASGLAALLAILPAAQAFMLGFAGNRVSDVGTPLRSQKITRTE